MAILDWYDSVWYDLFGMDWMLYTGTNKLLPTICLMLLLAGYLVIRYSEQRERISKNK